MNINYCTKRSERLLRPLSMEESRFQIVECNALRDIPEVVDYLLGRAEALNIIM